MSGLSLRAIDSGASVTALTYEALKRAVMEMNLYDPDVDLRIDERRLADELKVSRTPIREAIARLEHEGLLRTVPRRGTYVVRKTRREILDIIHAWAALESMAARLITQRATDEEIASLRRMFATFDNDKGRLEAHIDEYSDANLAFHQRIIELSGSDVIRRTVDGLFIHVQAMRRRTIREDERFARSIVDHMHIIEALEARQTELAERLVREHALTLARHVEVHVHYLGEDEETTEAQEAV
jgi:DNA-binding GntR family transcriptional regulator